MPVFFDLGAVFEYHKHVQSRGQAKKPLKDAIKGLNVQRAVEAVSKKVGDETVYLVPSITGRRGFLETGGKTFYEY